MERKKREIDRFRKQRERQSVKCISSLPSESFETTKPLILPFGYQIPKKQQPETEKDDHQISATVSTTTIEKDDHQVSTISTRTNIVRSYMRNYMHNRRQEPDHKMREAAKDRIRKQVLRYDTDYKNKEKMLEAKRKATKRSLQDYKEKEKERETTERKTKRTESEYKQKEKERETVQRNNKRTENEYKQREKERETVQRKTKRTESEYKQKEKERETVQRKRLRTESEYKQKEKERETVLRKRLRTESEYKQKEKERETVLRKRLRTESEYKQKEKERETVQRKTKRTESEYKQKEKERDTLQRKNKRTEMEYKQREKESESLQRKTKRTESEYKQKEKERETVQRKRLRTESEYKQKEKERETVQRKTKRTDPSEKSIEKERETLHRKDRRSNPIYRDIETVRETSRRQSKRTDTTYKNKERSRETITRANAREEERSTSIDELIPKFYQVVSEGPVYVCTSCKQLFYKHSVVKFDTAFPTADFNIKVASIIKDCPNYPSVSNKQWICRTCQAHIKKGKIPPLSTMNKMEFPHAGILQTLNPLEQTLLAVRLPFMKIHQAPRGKQHFLSGNMVLVPSDVSNTVEQLPRLITDTATIKAKLKRKLKYKHHVYSLNIRPELIRKAAHVLSGTPLYKEHNVTFDSNWQYDEELDCSTSDTSETTDKDTHLTNIDEKTSVQAHSDYDSDTWSEFDESEAISGDTDTLLTPPDFVDEHERELVYNFAPAEHNYPVSIFTEVDTEELSFPAIFCGQRRTPNNNRPVKVSYGEIVKSELRNVDRRAARSIENLFFKTKKIQLKTLLDQTNLAVRKIKTQNQTLTAKDVRGDAALNLVHQDKAYKFLANVRGSPPYFEKVSKDLFAMIKQLGSATFFVTLSAAETRWTHLIQILAKVVDGKDLSDEEADNLSWNEKCRLIQSDPITCARHFDFAVQKFFSQFLLSSASPLSKIDDYFYRVEYQQRGSPHVHIIVWCSDAPDISTHSTEDICNFIDKYITCKLPEELDALYQYVQLQTHRHSHTCRKKGKKKCRFGFPKPPMKQTLLLEPLHASECTDEDKLVHKKRWNLIYSYLNDIEHQQIDTIDDMLCQLDITEAEYILAVQASIRTTTIFLQRTLKETRINNYNPSILKAWRANIDVQFVLDVYACATYVASYITKSQRGMSELLRHATKEVKEGNHTIKEQVKIVGNKFLNAVEISAQEAAYISLQLPMKKCSRQCLFVNTSPPEDRVSLLKSQTYLDAMNDDDQDIECSNTISRYSNRPASLSNITLAEFAAYYDSTSTKPSVVRTNKFTKNTLDGLLPETCDSENEDAGEIQQETEHTAVKKLSEPQYKRRKTARILRTVHFNPEKDAENYYRELLMLYLPWRQEEQLKGNQSSFYEQYKANEDSILKEKRTYEPYSDTVALAQELLQELDNDDIWDDIAPIVQHLDEIDRAQLPDQPDDLGIEDADIALELGLPTMSTDTPDSIQQYELLDEQYREHMRSLNREQIEFVYDTIHQLKTSDEPTFRFLSGGAGVGKSFVIKALYQTALKFFNKISGENFTSTRILLLAPTGKAAYHIHGNTIHSALKLPANQNLVHKPLPSSTLNTLRNELCDLKLIIIDEISMVGFNMFNCIHQRLMEIMQNSKLFGGISVIAVGDLFQLKPVRDSYIFTLPKNDYMPLANNLWKDNFSMTELKIIMRQAENLPFAELLNRLREGNHTDKDIDTLKHRIIDEGNPNYPHHATHMFATNDLVNAYNSNIVRRSPNPVFMVKAQDRVIGANSPAMRDKILQTFNNNKQSSQLPAVLEVSEGIIYELTLNIDTKDGLINGASCKLVSTQLTKGNMVAAGILWVEFEDPKIALQLRSSSQHLYKRKHAKTWTPLQPIMKQFAAGHKGQAQIQRYQFPLRISHAKTIHRSQGDTMSTAVINMTSRMKVNHMHYVAISRLTSLDGLFITNLQESKISINTSVKNEMTHLRSMQIPRSIDFLYRRDSSLIITFLNARSLHRHIEDIQCDYSFQKADVLCFCETRLNDDDSKDDFIIPCFNQYRQDYKSNVSSKRTPYGLALYSKSELDFDFPKNISQFGIEAMLFKIQHIMCIALYKPPKKTCKQLCNFLASVHDKFMANVPSVLLGDFNIDWKKSSGEQRMLQDLLVTKFGFTQVIEAPTTDHGSTLDLIFTNAQFKNAGVLETFYSDHKSVWISFHEVSNDR